MKYSSLNLVIGGIGTSALIWLGVVPVIAGRSVQLKSLILLKYHSPDTTLNLISHVPECWAINSKLLFRKGVPVVELPAVSISMHPT